MAARIGLDGRALGNINRTRGIGRYTAHLSEALARAGGPFELVIFGYGSGPGGGVLEAASRGLEWREIPSPGDVEFYGSPVDHLRFAGAVDGAGIDLFHGIDHNMTPFLKCRSVVTVHDLIPLVMRGTYLGPRSWTWLLAHRRACARSDAVIAVSEATRDDIVRLWSIPTGKVRVIHEGVSGHYKPVKGADLEKYGIEAPYLLYIGGFDPRKNIYNMLLGYKRYRSLGGAAPIVLCGDRTGYEDALADMVVELGLDGSVRLPGFIDDEDLPALYSGASALIFVSLYEGFGLPLLEAMACGTPVVASNLSSIPFVAGDAAVLVDPLEPAEIGGAIADLEADPESRAAMVSRGLARSSKFTWDAAAGKVLELYRQVLGGGA